MLRQLACPAAQSNNGKKPGGTAPRRSNQARVAEVLGISLAELVSGGSNASGVDMRAEVPLVSEVEAGNYTVIDNFKAKNKFETVPVTVPVKRHTYALTVQGDSMIGEGGEAFPSGAVIVVEPDLKAEPGDFVIVMTAAGKTSFKQLIRDGDELYLKSLNIRYPIKPLGDSKVVGVVRELIKRFK